MHCRVVLPKGARLAWWAAVGGAAASVTQATATESAYALTVELDLAGLDACEALFGRRERIVVPLLPVEPDSGDGGRAELRPVRGVIPALAQQDAAAGEDAVVRCDAEALWLELTHPLDVGGAPTRLFRIAPAQLPAAGESSPEDY